MCCVASPCPTVEVPSVIISLYNVFFFQLEFELYANILSFLS